MSEAYWAPVVADAKKALANVDKNNKEAYAKALTDARTILYNHVPQGEPLAGYFTFVKWEKGAFTENKTYKHNYLNGTLLTIYKNGGYTESKGSYSYKQGDPSGDKLVEYTVGLSVTGAVYTLYGTQDAAVLALKKGEFHRIAVVAAGTGIHRGDKHKVATTDRRRGFFFIGSANTCAKMSLALRQQTTISTTILLGNAAQDAASLLLAVCGATYSN